MVGTVIHRFVAVDDDQGLNGAIVYSLKQLSPNGTDEHFVIQPFTGDLVIAQSLDITELYNLSVTATVREKYFCPISIFSQRSS